MGVGINFATELGKKKIMKSITRLSLLIISLFAFVELVQAQGEASTYFNVFVPPNNDPVKRNVCLVVTAIFNDTNFEIVDDGMDGDTDDSKSGTLSAGQSYVLYIADNGINDDAQYASGGVLKQDGDYFIVRSSKNVLVSQSTNSDWQHDFVPSIAQKGIGQRFLIYAPQNSNSNRDLNTFVYEDSTLVTIKKISTIPTTKSGYTNIDYSNATIVGTKLLNRGQDIIYFSSLGRDVMETGHSYMVESSKPITLQYGALFGNERDGGGNVPSKNGSSSGELFYFAVPYQSGGEQEIRVVSWDNDNTINLERYSGGNWISMKTWNLDKYAFSDWVGKSNGNASYPTVFRVTGTSGKRVSVFEANWLETGNPGTSDIGSMLSSEDGASAGKKFIAYIAPPGHEENVRDPFTGQLFGQMLSHLYISSRTGAHVTVKDAYSDGTDFSKSFDIDPERYVDCKITLNEWKNIYNGNGSATAGPERPYLIVESDKPISVFNTNFNDNWMAYLGTAQRQEFSLQTTTPSTAVIPGDTTSITTELILSSTSPVTNGTAELVVEGNVQIVSSTFNNTSGVIASGTVSEDAKTVTFTNLPTINSTDSFSFNTEVVTTIADNHGDLFIGNSVGTLTAELTGSVDSLELQAVSSNGIFVNSSDQSQLLFTRSTDTIWDSLHTSSWTVSLVDYNNDNWDDIFVTDNDKTHPNYLYRNNSNQSFTKINSGELITDLGTTIAASWADIDNDGDLDVLVINNTLKPNSLYFNNGNGTFTKNTTAGFVQQPAYYHNATWVDYDNDGLVDLFLCNYWSTKFNELWHNDGNGNFSLQSNSILSKTPGNAASVTWADYDNDGLMDVFIPNNKEGKNMLFHNDGNGEFSSVNNTLSEDGGFSVASCWGDVNGDGFLDLFVANASNRNNFLYINLGNGNFQKVTAGDVVNNGGHSHGCSFVDFDNDSDLDLYVSNDDGEKFLYANNGDGSFVKKKNEIITSDYGKALGHAWADLDKDGDLDLFSVTHGNEPNHLFWNNGNANHWLQIKLVGMETNKSAIGTRVHVKSNGQWQMREVTSQSGIGGQSSYRNHFGLGSATQVDSVLIQWPDGVRQTITSISADQNLIITEEAGGVLQAEFFIDANDNCQLDANEIFLPNQIVKVNPLGITLITDSNGKIQASLSPGDYTLEIMSNEKYSATCVNESIPVTLAETGQVISLGTIGMKPVCDCADANINMYTTTMRRGFGSDYFVEVSNTGSLSLENVEVKVTAPMELKFSSAEPTWNSRQQTADNYEYTWNLNQLNAGFSHTIKIRDSVSLNFNVGNEIQIEGTVTSTTSESDLENNISINTYEVVGAIDPNQITANPKGWGEEHYLEAGKEITYLIQFENFGNHETSFVTVTDTLSADFDLESIHSIQSDHGPLQTLVSGNIVTFYFPGINLTPASVDSVSSKGFVQFKIRTRPESVGQLINRASIVFDYNEPIITNVETHTLFNKDTTDELNIFPNPVSGNLTQAYIKPFGERNTTIVEASIFDMRGTVLKTVRNRNDFIILDVANLPNGVFIVKARSGDGHMYTSKLVVNR
jgi:uncharacterized repeat protein (TIGR01451 family)